MYTKKGLIQALGELNIKVIDNKVKKSDIRKALASVGCEKSITSRTGDYYLQLQDALREKYGREPTEEEVDNLHALVFKKVSKLDLSDFKAFEVALEKAIKENITEAKVKKLGMKYWD